MKASLKRDVARARGAFRGSPSLGLMLCVMPNCDQATRVRHPDTGEPICMTCGRAAMAVWPFLGQAWWKKPKGFRLAQRKSTPDLIVLRDGPLNGGSVRRGTKAPKEKRKKGDKGSSADASKSGTLVTWRTGFIRLVVQHPEEGALLALPGPQTLRVIGGYVYDSTDDSYWWCA